jgi:hypothetical protein
MRFRFRRASETREVPAWPFVGLGLVILAALGAVVSLLPARFIPPCGFHLLTGHPCPTCGVTRMGLALLHGHVGQALHENPFFFFVIAGLSLWVAAGAGARLAGRTLTVEVGAKEERWLWLALLVAFLANWWYLWHAGI